MQLVKNAAAVAWTWIVLAVKGLGSSVMAFVGSKQVWAAGVLFAFVGYYGGFLMTAGKVSSVAATNAALQTTNTALSAKVAALEAAAKMKAEMAPPAAPAVAADPVPAPTPAVRPKKQVKATPAVAVDKPWWKILP